MPLEKEFWPSIQPNDKVHFISCYPRSGSRWLRRIFSYTVAELIGHSTFSIYADLPTSYKTKNEVIVNAHYCKEFYTSTQADILPYALYRSHELSQLVKANKYKILYPYRDPIPLFVSYYFYANKLHTITDEKDFALFWNRRLREWVRHIQLALDFQKQSPDKIRFLKYNDESPFTVKQMEVAMRFLDMQAPKAVIGRAIASFAEELKQLNMKQPPHTRGSNLAAEKHYTVPDLSFIRSKTENLLMQAGALSVDI